ncbi:MAG: PqqD family protein [Desulfobacteraceae bacterium]|nr:MAG: PqqD family protein [Desulfobacteraceae bacterium]
MEDEIKLDGVYMQSPDVVAREIEGELIIIPLTAGIGDMEDELFSLNETGRTIWNKLDGKSVLKQVLADLSAEFEAGTGEIESDLRGFLNELFKRRMIVEVI